METGVLIRFADVMFALDDISYIQRGMTASGVSYVRIVFKRGDVQDVFIDPDAFMDHLTVRLDHILDFRNLHRR